MFQMNQTARPDLYGWLTDLCDERGAASTVFNPHASLDIDGKRLCEQKLAASKIGTAKTSIETSSLPVHDSYV